MDPVPLLCCPCGAPAPSPLPATGMRPEPCTVCATPLVQPGRLPREDLERAIGVALLVSSVLAVAWMFAARATGSSAHLVLPLAGALIGLAARLGAGTRGPPVQRTAGFSFAAFLVFGEVLLYRGALLARLVELHRGEGAADAAVLAQQELDGMELTQYLHVELTLTIFAGAAAGLFLALWLTRAPAAVAAFHRNPPEAVPPLEPETPLPLAADVELAEPVETAEPGKPGDDRAAPEDPSWP